MRLLSVALLALACTRPAPTRPTPSMKLVRAPAAHAIANRYIVVLPDGTPPDDVPSIAADLARAHGGTVDQLYDDGLMGFSVDLPDAAARALSDDPRVELVQQDARGGPRALETQVDPPVSLDRIDQRGFPLSCTYRATGTGAGVDVYVLDSGIRETHEDFMPRASRVFDAQFPPDSPAFGVDCGPTGHGTAVASLIGGRRFGVAKQANLLAVRVTDFPNPADGGRCTLSRASDALAGIVFVRKDVKKKRAASGYRPAVANLSIGYPANRALDRALAALIDLGVPAVVSGAEGADTCEESPGRLPAAITLGASDPRMDTRVNGGGPCADLFAPIGEAAASPASDTAVNPRFGGTSAAAPLVSGTVAIFLGDHPELGREPRSIPAKVTRRLLDRATRVPTLMPDRLLYAPLDLPDADATVSATSFAFTTTRGGNPPPQSVRIASTTADPVEVRVRQSTTCWLTVTPRTPPEPTRACDPVVAAPLDVMLAVNLRAPDCDLPPGTYNASVTVGTTGTAPLRTIAVTLKVDDETPLQCTDDNPGMWCTDDDIGQCATIWPGSYCCNGCCCGI